MPAKADPQDPVSHREWVARKLGAIEGKVEGICERLDRRNGICEKHALQITALQTATNETAGQRKLIRAVLPWVFAALGIGGFAGKLAADANVPAATPPTQEAKP